MKKHWRQDELDKLNGLDIDQLRDECRNESKRDGDSYDSTYPRLCGTLQYHLGVATKLAAKLMEELQEKDRKLDALQWAAESILNDDDVSTYDHRVDVYEMLYNAADIVEKAMEAGMSDDDLRKHLQDGITDDEYKQGRFLEEDELCVNCDEYCGKEVERCEICQEAFEEANAQA